MNYYLLTIIITLQILILALLFLLLQRINTKANALKTTNKESDTQYLYSTNQKIIKLNDLKTNFKIPYKGYLIISAEQTTLCINNKSYFNIKNNTETIFYLEEGNIIRIINPQILSKADFIELK